MTIIHSSDLGWTAGQDISDEFAALAQTFEAGDTFVFDHMYKIAGKDIQLPDDFTLAGGAPGAGIDVIDSAVNPKALLLLGHDNTLVDLTVTHSNSPQSGTDTKNPKVGVDYDNKITITAQSKDNVEVLNSYFEGNVTVMLRVSAGENLLIEGTEFSGGFYQVRLGANVESPVVRNSLFQDALGDGIKTIPGNNASGVTNATIVDSVFLNNGRDGIDTTGGFQDSIVSGSYFVNNGVSGLDIKTIYDSADDLIGGPTLNNNILITDSEFIDNTNALVVTTEDRGGFLNSANATTYAAQNINIEDTIFERTPSQFDNRMILVKDSYDVHWENVTLLGNVLESREVSNLNIGMPQDISGTNVTRGESRGELGDSFYQSLAGPDWSNISFPTDGTPTLPEPDPILYTAPDEPEPVVEASVPSNGAPAAQSDMVTTDHNKTVLVDVLGNDSDPDGDALTLTNVSYSGNTSIVSIKNGKIEVNPLSAATDARIETIVYTVSDGKGGTDTAELKVNIAGLDGASVPSPEMSPPPPVVEPPVIVPVDQPEPVVDTPVAPEPIVEAPSPEAAPVTSASDLLNIYVAYTDTDETISALGTNSVIDSNLTDGRKLTIYATSSGSEAEIGSVRLTVDGVGTQMENIEPYALFGDLGLDDFRSGKEFSQGSYSVELIVYSGKRGSGDVLETIAFDFVVDDVPGTPIVTPVVPVVEDNPVPAPEPVVEAPAEPEPVVVAQPETDLAPDLAPTGSPSQILDIKFVDTSTDQVLVDLQQSAKLSSDDFAGRKVSLSAEAIGSSGVNIGSVRLEMDGEYSRVENVEPYALFGDNGKGDFFNGVELADGTHFATLTAYSDKNGKGSVVEKVTVRFEVGDYDSVLVDGDLGVISSYSESQDTGSAVVSNDQRAIELEGSAWKAVELFEEITEETVLTFDFKSDAEGEIQGIGFINDNGNMESTFFQLDGSQELGIQEFNDAYEAGSGFKSYTIPVGDYFEGTVEQLVLISDDDADVGVMSTFSNIGLSDGLA